MKNNFSDSLQVNGGCPQSSVLGVYLFNIFSDELEDEHQGRGILDKDIAVVKYVDDQTLSEKLDVSNSIKMCINGRNIVVK